MKEAQCQHDEALLRVLQQARECNIKLNKDKLQLHLPEVIYIGHRVSAAGIKPKWPQSNRCPFLSQCQMFADF